MLMLFRGPGDWIEIAPDATRRLHLDGQLATRVLHLAVVVTRGIGVDREEATSFCTKEFQDRRFGANTPGVDGLGRPSYTA